MKNGKVDPAEAVGAAGGVEDGSLGQASDSLLKSPTVKAESFDDYPDLPPSLDRRLETVAAPSTVIAFVARSRREDHKQLIWVAWRKTAEAYIETGKLLIAAKADLPHGEWEAFVESDLPFDKTTVERLMKIARDPVLANPANTPLLPAAWSTAYELTKVAPKTLEAKLKDGKISAKLKLKEVKGWAAKKTLPKQEPTRSDVRRAAKKVKKKLPLPDCPLCEGAGKIRVNIYGPCGLKENSEPLAGDCACLTMNRRAPFFRADLQRARDQMEEQTRVAEAPPPEENGEAPEVDEIIRQLKARIAELEVELTSERERREIAESKLQKLSAKAKRKAEWARDDRAYERMKRKRTNNTGTPAA